MRQFSCIVREKTIGVDAEGNTFEKPDGCANNFGLSDRTFGVSEVIYE